MHTRRRLPHRHQNRQRGKHQRNPARLAVRPHPPHRQGYGRRGQPLPHHRMERPPHGRGQTSRRPRRRNRQRAGLAAAAILRPDHPIRQGEARTAGRLPANRRRKHTLRRNRPRRLARQGLHPAQRRSHPPRQRRSGARDIQRRQKPSDGTAKTGTQGRPPACRAYPATRGRDWASTTACTASRTARH